MTPREQRTLICEAFGQTFGREPSLPEAQIVHGVGVLETNCGQGWKSEVARAANNWGAIQYKTPGQLHLLEPYPTYTPDQLGFLAVDTHPRPDGTSVKYAVYFRRYPTPLDGAKGLVMTVYVSRNRNTVLEAAQRGDVLGASRALYSTGYYEGAGIDKEARIMRHFGALRGAIQRTARVLNEQLPASLQVPPTTKPDNMPTIYRGSTLRDAVRAWQRYFHELAADGLFGPHTEAVTKAWQAANGLTADGIVGPASWAKMAATVAAAA